MRSKQKEKTTKKQWALFITGLAAILIGTGILGFFGGRKLYREYLRHKLMRENPVIEIADLNIKAPVLEGTDKEVLARAAGHFIGSGDLGKGNYCIAGHSSTIYKEYFNDLKKAKTGMEIKLYDKDKNSYSYIISDSFIVEPDETWILNDFGDNRVTIVTCTDDGTQRQIVVGILK